MRGIGMLTTLALIAGLVVAVKVGLASKEDLERYIKMRNM